MTPPDPANPTPPRPRQVGSDGAIFKCPICRTILPNADLPTFPFCSDRCRLIDLGNWLDGSYTTSRPIDPSDDLEDLSNPPPLPRPNLNPPDNQNP